MVPREQPASRWGPWLSRTAPTIGMGLVGRGPDESWPSFDGVNVVSQGGPGPDTWVASSCRASAWNYLWVPLGLIGGIVSSFVDEGRG